MSGLMYGAGSSGSGSGAVGDKEKQSFGLDPAGEKTFVQYFKSMPEKADNLVRLFDRTEFFSCHGDDAILVATTVFKTLSVLKYLGSNGAKTGLPSITLTIPAAKAFLREALTSKQMRVEIWKGGGKRVNGWTLDVQASPGNLQGVEGLLFSNTDMDTSPIVVAIKLSSIDGVPQIGAAFADASTRTLGVTEFADNDLFSNVESLLIQLGVKECLVAHSEKDTDLARMVKVIDRCGVLVTELKASEWKSSSIEDDVSRLLQEDNAAVTRSEFSMKIALGAMSALLSYLGLMQDETNFGRYSLITHDLSRFLRLDASAVRALSLFPEPGQGAGNKHMSVHGLLNKCRTAQGSRLLGQWLKQPLVNLHEIRRRHDVVEVFVSDPITRQTIQSEHLRFMPDLHRISKKFQKDVGSLEDVVRVYQAVLKLGDLAVAIDESQYPSEEHRATVKEMFTEPIQEHQKTLEKLVEMVESTIDLDELANHNFVIKPDFDDKLRRIKDKLDEIRDKLDQEHRRAGRDLNLDTDKEIHLENHSSYGYCLRITRTKAAAIKNKRGYQEIATVKSGIYFTTSTIKDLSSDFQTLTDQYSSQQSGLVKDVIRIAASYCTPLEQLNVHLASLDVLIAFAHVSANAPEPYVRPQLSEMGQAADLKVTAARHPVLEVQEDISFIANDVEMVKDESEFLLITGPNMGGKSTYIRQVGILALMAQAGCFVPAEAGAQLPIFDCILARVGAGDSQVKGVSTFMQEMLELAQILKTATADSLVLIDELGRGTSTYDGFGIAYAASEWIATQIRCKTLFASHFAEITSLAEQQNHVKNLHVVAHVSQRHGGGNQDQDITLLYQVKPGVSDRSYGIHVAELAGFPESVIRLAKRKAEELEDYQDEEESEKVLDADLPAAVTEEGTKLVEEFLRTWAERSRALAGEQDEEMAGEEDVVGRKGVKLDPAIELAELRKVVGEYRQRIEGNAWAARVLKTF